MGDLGFSERVGKEERLADRVKERERKKKKAIHRVVDKKKLEGRGQESKEEGAKEVREANIQRSHLCAKRRRYNALACIAPLWQE